MGRFISDSLFHFVGRRHPAHHERNYDVLRTILNQGCVSHPPHDDTWGAVSYRIDLSRPLLSEEMLVPTVTCYSDIPFEHLSLHMRKYGSFGVALRRHYLIKHSARPVIYVPLRSDDWAAAHGGHTWLHDVEAAFRGFRTYICGKAKDARGTSRTLGALPRSAEEAAVAMDSALTLNFLAFIKPYNSMLPEDDLNYFYSEREWRKFGNLRFEPADVESVVVHGGYVDRVKRDLPQYGGKVVSAPA